MKLFKEPILHFAAAGALLFSAYALIDGGAEAEPASDAIIIGDGEIRWLQETFAGQRQRPPTPQELEGLLNALLEEELLAREARALGLENGDTIVRRRLAQKLDFVISDTFRLAEPSEDDLRRYYADHSEDFTTPSRISFEQRFFSPQRREDAEGDAKAALQKASAQIEVAPNAVYGDPLFLEGGFESLDAVTLTGLFGPDFAEEVFALPPGVWAGPVTSGYGVHLVKVTQIEPGRLPPFEDLREDVAGAWREAKLSESRSAYLAALREKYGVILSDSARALLPAKTLGGGE